MSGSQKAVVVGSGPNGLSAAAFLAQAGWQVEVFERNPHPGGAAASAELLGPGVISDMGAAGHPFGIASPAFRQLDLAEHGLRWAHSTYPMAHPLEDRPAALLHRDLAATAEGLGGDGRAWTRVHRHLVEHLDDHLDNFLAPMLRFPAHPLALARLAPRAALPAATLARAEFRDPGTRALFSGSAVHAITSPGHPFTAAFGMLFGALGMNRGWPVVAGGTGALIDALVSKLHAHGGRVHLNSEVTDLRELPEADAVILNLTPTQILGLSGAELPAPVRGRFKRWRYGPGSHKVDYLLDGPVPWQDPEVGEATTVHVCGSTEEIREAETMVARGQLPRKPFVMVCQQQAADPGRVSGPAAGKTVIWAYAHVPHGYAEPYPGQVRELIETQIERFAPGFRDRVLNHVEYSPRQLEAWNPNLIGGDVAAGAMNGLQSVLRPGLSLRPHRLGRPGWYLASGATPPGGGVHGMAGYWAAQAALADLAPR